MRVAQPRRVAQPLRETMPGQPVRPVQEMVPGPSAEGKEIEAAEERTKASALHTSTKSAETITNRILCLMRADWNPPMRADEVSQRICTVSASPLSSRLRSAPGLSPQFPCARNADSGSLIQ
jgi:hypothetical protein